MSAAGMELLAQIWHAGQYRRGPERTPYIEHPKAVVAKLMEWGVFDDDTLAMAWGHDLLEDTKCPAKDILRVGGQEVLDGIYMLTRDDVRWPKKGGWIAHLAQNAPRPVLLVKASDRLCNALDFIKAGRKEKAMAYLRDSFPVIAKIHPAIYEYEQLMKS